MTAIADPTAPAEADIVVELDPGPTIVETPAPEPASPVTEAATPLRPVRLTIGWLLITVVGVALVMIAVGPLAEQRDQRRLLDDYRGQIESASNEAFGLEGVETPTEAPSRGAPVAILDIDAINLRRVVVEGTAPAQTRQGPGHVVGTGGPGQPGNSVVVGRNGLWGGAFADLDQLDEGDEILVSTVQGQSAYVVDDVGTVSADDLQDDVYGPTDADQLTLVTSASDAPWASDEATVVIAHMKGAPFAPTPQGGRTAEDDGRHGDSPVSAALFLALLAYGAAVVGAVWLHRHVPWRSAYLLSAPLLVALTIVLAEQLAATFPAWG
jgi:sortase A